MSKPMSIADFRAVRVILEPDDFALGSEEPDPPPSDRIAEKTWHGIMNLPDDVAIRTSDHNGQIPGEVYWLWGRWIRAVGMTDDALFVAMLDATDDLQASFFDALHGYYRTAFSALRNVIELMTIGACGMLTKTPLYKEWREGSTEFKFGAACDLLSNEISLSAFNQGIRTAGYQSLWDAKRAALRGGYSRRLYRDMCNFAHSRPGFTDGDLRSSNGPIYIAKVFWHWYLAYLRTVSLCSIYMCLARPNGELRWYRDLFVDDPDVVPPELFHAKKIADPTEHPKGEVGHS